MDDRKTLIAAVAEAAAEGNNDSESKYKGLLAFVKRHFSRGDDLNLGEVLQTMGKKDHQKLWTRLMEVVTPIIEEERFMMVKSKHDANGEDSDAPPAGADEDLPKEGPMNDTGDTPERRTPSERESPKCRPRRDGEKTRKEAGVSVALEVLHATAVLAQEFLSDKERVAPRALLETAAFLHGIILSLQGLQGTVLQGVIAKVCEMWWTQERPGGEHLVTQLLPLMLVRSLDEHAKEADVKRVFGMRTALLLLDFDDESSDSLRALLLRSFISPLYLKSSEGKRLLAYLFGLHQSLVLDIHAVIKAQIPGAKRAVLAAYGEIYFRVWRGAEGPYLEKVETHCLQELMHACIHASTPKMHASLLVVLDGVHSQKKTKGMDAALLRLYGPVLWRALRVANPTVRAQACQVLVDAFPLQDPSAGAAAYEAVLLQQFDAFAALLEDGHPRVRAVAAKDQASGPGGGSRGRNRVGEDFRNFAGEPTSYFRFQRVVSHYRQLALATASLEPRASKGVCQVLSVYWETFPVATTRALLSRVVGRLASDGTSAMVRLGAVEGLVTLLLDCPASHGVLKAMLPGVSRLIHDNNKRVRVAFVKLLRLVKGMRSIKYYHVVPVDHILARLAEDHLSCPASASGLTELILNSYFPTGLGITGSLQVSRCLTLLSQDEPAATAFYGRLHQHAGVPSAAKVLAMLVRCAVVAARKSADEGDGIMPPQKEGASRKSGKRKGLEAEGGVSGKGGGERRTLKASDSKAMSGVLNLIATIWESLLPSLEESVNEPSLQLIQETFTGEALAVLHRRFFRDEGCRSAFMRVAGLAGLGLTPGMLEEVVLEMLAMPADATPRLYGPTVELLCSWGQEEHLIGAIVNSLQRSFSTATFTEDLDNASAEETVSRGKRPRPVRGGRDGRGDGIDRNSDDGYDETGLHPSLALSMLNHLLAGGNGHAPTLAARDSIIFDDIASHALESTLSLARERADARLCAVSGRPASVVAEVSKGNERRFRRCPDAILVRAVEALGRVFMHREAALVGDLHGGVYASRVNGETQQGKAGEEEEAILRPMPFSVKMRELMVWTTNTVLPALAGLSGDVADGMAAATPVKPAAVPGAMSIESPSPLPPPRAKARGAEGEELVSVDAPASSVSAPSNSTVTAVTEDMGLAEGLLGTVVLLAAEWVEVGSGLAEVSMRADTWGDRLLDLLLQQDEACFERVVAVLPQLCRLGLKLSGREAQGARPSASMCEVLLRCADCCLAEEEEGCTKGMRSSTPVQRYLAAAVALQGKRGDLSPLMERLLGFAFTQASAVYVEDCEHDIRGEVSRSTDIDDLVRLRVPPYGTAVASEGAVVSSSDDACFLLELSRPAAAVLALVLRSTPASNAAGSLVLAHLGIFRPGDAGTDAAWPLFCAHVLGALIDHAPAKARLEIAAEAHLALKGATAAAAAAATAGASLMTEDNVSAYVNGEGKLEGEREIDTKKATIFAVRAIYGRLEAARRAAAIVGMDVGGDKGVPEAQACAVVGEDSVVMVPV